MIKRFNLFQWLLTLLHFSLPLLSFLLAGYLRFRSPFFPEVPIDPYQYTLLLLVATVFWAIASEHYGLTRLPLRRAELVAMATATALTLFVQLAVLFFANAKYISRLFIAGVCAMLFCGGILLRVAFMRLLRWTNQRDGLRVPVAILGADDQALQVAEELTRDAENASDVRVFVALANQPGQIPAPAPVVGWEQREYAVEEYGCQEALLVLPPERFSELPELMTAARQLCIPVRLTLKFGQGLLAPHRLNYVSGIPVLDLQPYPVDTVGYQITKRLFDFAFATLALLFIFPLLLLIALAIKLTSPGPVFFSQERVGLNGRRFHMLKFRTMRVQEHGTSNTQHTAKDDKRITRVGAWLRRTSLDELPQFINVLRGEMSVVGPRPELTFFVQKFRHEIPAYMFRHNIRCGITGWAQINGLRGSDTSFLKRIEYDIYYMQNWSLALDVKIILRTVLSGLVSRQAY
jgi:exopolysaccharide biosynthesis polyprenyl glycosylphosphotransferase